MIDMLTRAILVICGLACVGTEVWGAFDFLWERYGRWNYLVMVVMSWSDRVGFIERRLIDPARDEIPDHLIRRIRSRRL